MSCSRTIYGGRGVRTLDISLCVPAFTIIYFLKFGLNNRQFALKLYGMEMNKRGDSNDIFCVFLCVYFLFIYEMLKYL